MQNAGKTRPFRAALSHLGARGRLVVCAAALGALVCAAMPGPAPRTVEGVASMLGDAVGGHVEPADFVWEAAGSPLGDALAGRSVLFLASKNEGPRDLYRARVRVARSGQPIEVVSTRDLSRTPVGDERDLVARGHHAAVASVAYGAVQAITLVDLRGDARDHDGSLRSRVRAAASGFLDGGLPERLVRTELTTTKPLVSARFELSDEALILALGDEAAPASVALEDGATNPGPGDPFGFQIEPRRSRLASDRMLVRGALARLTSDKTARAALAAWSRVDEALAELRARREAETAVGAHPAAAEAPEAASANEEGWPPRAITPRFDPPLDSEGVWRALVLPPRATRVDEAPTPMLVTRVRPDADDARVIVHLVAMDMRQLDLRMQAGRDTPHPAVGAHGMGRVEATRFGREESLVAVFNGASTARGGALGMVARDRVIVPPAKGAPTIAIERRGRAAFGAWPLESAQNGASPSLFVESFGTVSSLVQTARPLLDTDAPEPIDAAKSRPKHRVARSALCLTTSRHLVYGYAAESTEEALTQALKLAGCSFALALASAPDAVGLAMRGACATSEDTFAPALIDASMTLAPEDACEGSSGDFLYVAENDSAPPFAPPDDASWQTSAGKQPAPAWRPAMHETTVEELGARVVLTTLSAKRFSWRIRAGEREPSRRGDPALPRAIEADAQPLVIAALGLGLSRRRPARGLTIDGISGKPFRSAGGALVLDPVKQRLSVAILPDPVVPEGGSAVELPLAANEGKLLREAREIGTRRSRGALCVHEDGTVIVASAIFDSDEATTEALLAVGCTRVVALDRGSGRSHTFHRAGTDEPPQASYETTTLFALERPMNGRAERFGE